MSNSKGKWILGLIIILAGLATLSNNLGLTNFDLGHIFGTYWPVLIIALGLNFILNHGSTGEMISGVIIVVVGAILLGNSTGTFNVDLSLFFKLFWPVIIILVGLSIFFSHGTSGKNNFAIMSAIERKTQPWKLQTGSFVAFMGGVDLDISLAEINEGETVLDLTAFMGGIDIILPEDIYVECNGTAILGGLELLDHSTGGIYSSTKAVQGTPDNKKILKIYSRAIMGGIEIKTKKARKKTEPI
ncbi:MAG: cell wall-active antibiotics response protein [Eubacteriaceae bacterium]|nr:cell wall-active antibiotics response protein [Eubacteriaceae bacterium]